MNLILLKPGDFTKENQAVLAGRRCEHILNIHQAGIGDQLECGLIDNRLGTAVIRDITSTSVKLDIILDREPPEPLPVTLVLAMPRPKAFRRILQTVTTLGIKSIYLINSWRVEKSYWQSPVLSDESIEKQLVLGLEQGKDTIPPTIHFRRFFTNFVKEELPIISKDSICLTAHPKSASTCPSGITRQVTLVIGPEGGFIDLEIKTLEDIGFKTVSIGRRILTVETAVPYLISRLFSSLNI